MSETHEEDDSYYLEPLSLAEHQQLIHSARKIVKRSRKFFAHRKPKLPVMELVRKKSEKNIPEAKPRFNIVEQGKKLVLMPREAGKPQKIIQLPPKAVPDVLTIRRIQGNLPSRTASPIPSTSIKDIKAVPSTSTNNLPKFRQFVNISKLKTVNLTIGNKKIVINPQSIRKIQNPNIIRKEPTIEDLPNDLVNLNPENFPKAIVYPEAPKEKPPMKIKSVVSKSPFTFNLAFEESTHKKPDRIFSRAPNSEKTKFVVSASTANKIAEAEAKRAQKRAIDDGSNSPKEPTDLATSLSREASPKIDEESVKAKSVEKEVTPNEQVEESTSRPQSSSSMDSPKGFFEDSEDSEEDYDDDEDSDDQFMAISDDPLSSATKDTPKFVPKILQTSSLKSVSSTSLNIASKPQDAKEVSRLRFLEKLKQAQEERERLKKEEIMKSVLAPPQINQKSAMHLNAVANTPIRICVPRKIQEVITQVQGSQIPQVKKPQAIHHPPKIRQVQPILIDDDEEDEEQFEAVKNDSTPIELLDEDFVMPARPETNISLIDLLAHYRAIARYLMQKKNISPFNFDSTGSEYIPLYRTLQK